MQIEPGTMRRGAYQPERAARGYFFERLHRGMTEDDSMFRSIAALRYDVYCLERRYIDRAAHPELVETDEFDARSIHFAAYASDKFVVGSVRLVQATGTEHFPFEDFCPLVPDFVFPPREKCGEVSRLVVRKNFRGQRGLGASSDILLGLYRELFRVSRRAGVRYLFAAMERPLARALSQVGVHLKAIGPESDYAGPVVPYFGKLDQLQAMLDKANPSLAAWFNQPCLSA